MVGGGRRLARPTRGINFSTRQSVATNFLIGLHVCTNRIHVVYQTGAAPPRRPVFARDVWLLEHVVLLEGAQADRQHLHGVVHQGRFALITKHGVQYNGTLETPRFWDRRIDGGR